MRKGLTQTLMAVAVVMMAAQAMAMAPTIGDIPSPIVGDLVGVTDSDLFVYPDAFDLTKYGQDRETPQSQLLWTYYIDPAQGAPKYTINGVAAQTALSNEQTTPTAGNIIAGPGATDADGGRADNNPNTITIRNIDLSPVGNPLNANTGTTGVITAETQAVTFFVTDLNQASDPKSVFFYTASEENDRLSGNGAQQFNNDFHTTNSGFVFTYLEGTFVGTFSTTNGMCMQTFQFGNNAGLWSGPFGMLQLAQNAVYQIRATVNGTQDGSTTNKVPFWDLIVNNYGYDSAHVLKGMNLYGSNFFFLDNTGGANATYTVNPDGTGTPGTKVFELWWTPPAVSTTQWNDTNDYQGGPWAPSNAGDKDAFIEWRILDSERNGGIQAFNAQGTLCLQQLTVTKFDLTNAHVVNGFAPLYDNQTMTLNLDATTSDGTVRLEGSSGFTAAYAAGDHSVTLTPTNTVDALAQITPGDFVFDYFVASVFTDNYPVHMDPQKVYLIQYELSAPTATDAANPQDIYWLGADTPSNELINLSYTVAVNSWHHGAPNTTKQMFKALFASNYATRRVDPFANPAWWSSFRPRYMGGNNLLGGGELNTGAIKISRIKVDQVEWQ